DQVRVRHAAGVRDLLVAVAVAVEALGDRPQGVTGLDGVGARRGRRRGNVGRRGVLGLRGDRLRLRGGRGQRVVGVGARSPRGLAAAVEHDVAVGLHDQTVDVLAVGLGGPGGAALALVEHEVAVALQDGPIHALAVGLGGPHDLAARLGQHEVADRLQSQGVCTTGQGLAESQIFAYAQRIAHVLPFDMFLCTAPDSDARRKLLACIADESTVTSRPVRPFGARFAECSLWGISHPATRLIVMHRMPSRRTAAALTALLIGLAATGCGDSGDDAAQSDTREAGTTAQATTTAPATPSRAPQPTGSPVTADPTIVNPHPIPFRSWSPIAEDRIAINFEMGSPECYGVDAVTTETDTTVTVELRSGTRADAAGRMCVMIAMFTHMEIQLEQPLGDRTVLSAS